MPCPPRIAEELGIAPRELAGTHRRFEIAPGAQAQGDWGDWGDEGKILAHLGIPKAPSAASTAVAATNWALRTLRFFNQVAGRFFPIRRRTAEVW